MLSNIQTVLSHVSPKKLGSNVIGFFSIAQGGSVPRTVLKSVQADVSRNIALFNIFCSLMVLVTFWSSEQFWLALFWYGIYMTANCAIFIQLMAHANKEKISDQDTKPSWQSKSVASTCVINALSWLMLCVLLFPSADATGQLVIVCIMAGMLGGGGFILSFRPQMAMIYICTIFVGCELVLFTMEGFVYSILAVLLAGYTLMMIWALKISARVQVEGVKIVDELEQHSRTSSTLLGEIKTQGVEWLWETDERGRLVNVSAKGEEISGLQRWVLETMTIDKLFLQPKKCSIAENGDSSYLTENLGLLFEEQKSFERLEAKLNTASEREVWVSIAGNPCYDAKGEFIGYRGFCLDITSNKEKERQLKHLAYYDALTGLYNRDHFGTKIGQSILEMRATNVPFTLMIMDFNKFRKINDTLGYPAGDAVLTEVSNRIKKVVGEDDYVARLGADEFAIIFAGIGTKKEATVKAEQLANAFNTPINAIGWSVNVKVSIGITMAPSHGWFRVDLLNNAALAHYRAKEDMENSFHFFSPDMGIQVRERLELEMELREAIRQNQLMLYYQPLMEAKSNEICSYEALIRWKHPKRGMISPAVFIPIAEDSNMIIDIGEFVIRQACLEAASWNNDRRIAVNVSAKHFTDSNILAYVSKVLEETGLEPYRLELELTESVLVENAEATLATLRNLKALGVKIALDDFGTGYSSLLYLVDFQFDKIKIDQGFVKKADKGNDRMAVIRAVILLAKSLGIRSTAEGVETLEKFKLLSDEGCDEIQGYLISKPVPGDQIAGLDLEISKIGIQNEIALQQENEAAKEGQVAENSSKEKKVNAA